MSDEKPTIDIADKGPFIVKNLKRLFDDQNQPIEMAKDVIALCRCGASKNKPFCDGTHKDIGFTGALEREETYETKEYAGAELTIVDNIGICCHAGACVNGIPSVFFEWEGEERVSVPDAEDKEKIIEIIRQCPSGSLAYRLNSELQDEYFSESEIVISKDGPLHVRGKIALNEGKPLSTDHYTLCRCGASKNKPFCDGAHKEAGFKG
ncbi:MAG: CDGSH-type Zn-finger protein [Candidatus Latescibacterota bacterium]|jgi:CDGSH-type Zn-finger protein